ncbi:hypothetical protein E4U43_005032 [Claviceps pusilla]|uniref:Uncharacterized protein n=1 Tax=Claviceps pusilla TaxID=123648 RepID=A0A9P7SUB7_9HYPO|nr:hypothetical protein E4U43_005032 [Claviceps pusilla]
MFIEKVNHGSLGTTTNTKLNSNRVRLQESTKSSSSAWNYFTEDLRSSTFTELQLVILTFCTGIQGESRVEKDILPPA